MDFYKILLHSHKGFAYLELLFATLFLVALLATMFGFSGKVNKLLKKTTLFTMIFFHIQFTIGAIMLFVSPGVKAAISSGTLMSDSYSRFQYVEHPFSMLIAAVLMTIINKKLKTADTISVAIVTMGVIAVALFGYAFPWATVSEHKLY